MLRPAAIAEGAAPRRRNLALSLPDPGMGDYTDKVAKSLYPDDLPVLAWRKPPTAPLGDYERPACSNSASRCSWEQHAALARTEIAVPIFK